MIRVLLVDDHEVVRAGLEQLLATTDDLQVVGAAGEGAEAVSMAAELDPDVVLMDLNMPHVDGIEATRRIAAAQPNARIVVLTSFSDRERILEAIAAGAVGYLLKDAPADEIRRGIRAASRGESPLTPRAARTLLGALAERREAEELSEREREVMALLAEGFANKQIAFRLHIKEKTVKAHLTNIFRRIGVSDRTQAALWAERRGLIRPEGGRRVG